MFNQCIKITEDEIVHKVSQKTYCGRIKVLLVTDKSNS